VKVVNYTIIIPENIAIELVVLKLEYKEKTCNRNSSPPKGKQAKYMCEKRGNNEEPEEGLLFEELY
jgi:hypothetical protein